jgi:outer membrane receptor for ferric coprogen and ferric-rhodotorulic acid
VFYGVLENKLSDKTTLTLGYSYPEGRRQGAMWGALPMSYRRLQHQLPGGHQHLGLTGPIWIPNSVFAELAHALDNGWQWKSTLGYNQFDTDSALFYVYGTPNKSTGGGLYAYPSLYDSSNKQVYFDSNLGGKYTLAERQHDFNIGEPVTFAHDGRQPLRSRLVPNCLATVHSTAAMPRPALMPAWMAAAMWTPAKPFMPQHG